MAPTVAFKDPGNNPLRRWLLIAIAALLVLALGVFIYRAFTGVQGIAKPDDRPPVTAVNLPPMPPPPPPPPEPVEKPPEPTEAPTPTPDPVAAKPDAPAPMQMDAPAQAGVGGIASGSGAGGGAPGSTGVCLTPPCGTGGGGSKGINDTAYRMYLRSAIQDIVERDGRVNKERFTADFEIVVAPNGRVERVRLRNIDNSGIGAALQAVLANAQGLRAPPVESRYPILISVRGRRRPG